MGLPADLGSAHLLLFQSTHPLRGGTRYRLSGAVETIYFNPPTPCGVGRELFSCTDTRRKFQSTHPLRGGTITVWPLAPTSRAFQSTHPLRGGTINNVILSNVLLISIHPPLAGWDRENYQCQGLYGSISIHPPLAGWDRERWSVYVLNRHFNPPTPCGVGLICCSPIFLTARFQSTHPLRGGTIKDDADVFTTAISIHPPLAGWDGLAAGFDYSFADFNPPTPCGVGLVGDVTVNRTPRISIHPPLAGWDCLTRIMRLHPSNFNPPTPCGVGPRSGGLFGVVDRISIHPPLAGWDERRL